MGEYNELLQRNRKLHKKNEISKKYHEVASNNDDLINKWHIGRLITEAQGGKERAKYGNELIKKWTIDFTKKYGKGYDYTNLSRFRNFYNDFPILGTVCQELTWSHIRYLLPIKEENKRNYYINKTIENNWSVRRLMAAIKANEYERLINKLDKIEIKSMDRNQSITSDFKDPIIVNIPKGTEIKSEKDLEVAILAQIQYLFSQLGKGFTLVGNQYPIPCEGKKQYIDILLFNYKFNSFVVVELKLREVKAQDKGQIESYMEVVDREIKEPFHNNTVGIIISKKNNKLIAELITGKNIYALTYQLANYKN